MSEKLQKYRELLILTKKYIAQEYPINSHKVFESSAFNFFSSTITASTSTGISQTKTYTPPTKAPSSKSNNQQGKIQQKESKIETNDDSIIVKPKRPPKTTSSHDTFEDLQDLYQKFFPQSKVVVISISEEKNDKDFLNKVTIAINQRLNPAVMVNKQGIDKAGGYQALTNPKRVRMVLISRLDLKKLPELQQLKTNDTPEMLGEVPLIIIDDISKCTIDKQAKANLWKQLCNILSP